MNRYRTSDKWLNEHVPEIHTSMIETAEIVAERYGVSREVQDEYAYQSQQRTAAAQAAGVFDAEIAPLTSIMMVQNKETGEFSEKEVRLTQDEGNRPQTTLADLQKLAPVFKGGQIIKEGKYVTAGNASQLSDGAAAVVLMERNSSSGVTPSTASALVSTCRVACTSAKRASEISRSSGCRKRSVAASRPVFHKAWNAVASSMR